MSTCLSQNHNFSLKKRVTSTILKNNDISLLRHPPSASTLFISFTMRSSGWTAWFLIVLALDPVYCAVLKGDRLPHRHASEKRHKRELLSTSLTSATAVVAVPTAILIGGAAVGAAIVSSLITWGLISDSDLLETVEELCEGRERACLAKLHMFTKRMRTAFLITLILFDSSA
ncbi:hypothetical protein QR680_007626 [Steinernema hermaphroditum]|uniref:Uncharacterized protein n=1 Tax=Steinernema hermaphroditum TaxID=289476 RepID=A0AA39IDT5_9BILA|nr:hypothetical protein QR680_007626 [Steinernema hermaphroditum]